MIFCQLKLRTIYYSLRGKRIHQQRKRTSRTSQVCQLEKMPQKKRKSRTNQVSQLKKIFQRKLVKSRTSQLSQLKKMSQKKRKTRNIVLKMRTSRLIRTPQMMLSLSKIL